MEIIKRPFSGEMVDVMGGCESWSVRIDEHGLCELWDVMPRLVPAGRTADVAIAQGARMSTGGKVKTPAEDRGLIRHLYSHRHTSPLELVEMKFHHVLPIFVARQLVRHRTANLNEFSMRYSEAPDRFWITTPDQLRSPSAVNKQMTVAGGVDLQAAEAFLSELEHLQAAAMSVYRRGLDRGIGKEQARVALPVSLYTEWVWKIDLHNLLHFLSLRQDKHAQEEIRVYADAMYQLIRPIVPAALEAYDDYHPNRGGMHLSRMEVQALEGLLQDTRLHAEDAEGQVRTAGVSSDREAAEFTDKLKRMGLIKG